MIRNFFSTITVFSLLALGACGDDGKSGVTASGTDTDANTTPGMTEATNPTDGTTTDPGTTTVEPTTTTSPTTTSPGTTTIEPGTTTVEPGTTTVEPGTTTVEPGTTTTEPGTGTDTGTDTDTSTSTTGDPIQQCLDDVDPPNDPCGTCACESCNDALEACAADEGCTAIRECALESGCGGVDCLGPCGAVINMYGGFLGASVGLGQDVLDCLDAECPGLCT